MLNKLAVKAAKKGNIPVSALIVKDKKVISYAYNKKETTHIATAHAELIAINKACKRLKTWHLDNCTLYTTLKPCKMCEGAINEARINKVYYILDSLYHKNELCDINYEKIDDLNNNYRNTLKSFFKTIR